MKAHAGAEMKDEGGGIGLIPALGQGGSEVEAGVAGDEAVEE